MTMEYIKQYGIFEVTLTIDANDTVDTEVEATEDLYVDIDRVYVADPKADVLSGKMISLRQHLSNLCIDAFSDQHGDYASYRRSEA